MAMAMDGPTLSGWEKKILTEVENELRADERLNRALSTMRPAGLLRADNVFARIARVPLPVMALLGAVSAALVAVGVWVDCPNALLLLALVWAPGLAVVLVRVGHGPIGRRRARRGRS